MIKIALIDDEKEVLGIIQSKIELIDNLGEKIRKARRPSIAGNSGRMKNRRAL